MRLARILRARNQRPVSLRCLVIHFTRKRVDYGHFPRSSTAYTTEFDPPPRRRWTVRYLSQDDIDAGLVASNATITAVSPFPNSVPIESEAKDTTDVPRDSSILVEKTMKIMTTVSGLDTELSDADDWAIFDIVVTNTGNTALSKVVLTDDMFSEGSTACNNNFSAATSNFLPSVNPDGAAIGCEVTLNLTSAHVDAGEISGTAKVSSQAAHCLSKRSP